MILSPLRSVSWPLLAIVFVASLLLWPSLSAGLIADDWWHYIWIQALEHHPAPRSGALFDLFSFASDEQASRDYLITRGGIPWWSSESLQVNFWRPIAEISHLDYRLFGLEPNYLRAQSIFWFAVLLWAVHGFYQRIGLSKAAVIIALLIVATEPFHSLTVTWLANRNILIAAVFVFLSLNSYLGSQNSPKAAYSSYALYIVALLSSEAATSLLAFLLAHAACLDRRSFKSRALSVMPYLLVTISWLLIYRYLGFGASGNAAMYVDPVAKPMVFLQQLGERIPIAFNLQLLILPKLFPEFWHKQALLLVGLVLLFAALLITYLKKSRLAGFTLIAFVLAVVPLASALLHERNFIFLSIAVAPMLAMMIVALWHKKAWWSRILAGLIGFYKVVLGALLMYLAIWYFSSHIGGQIVKTKNSLPDDAESKNVFVIGAPIIHASFVYPMRLAEGQAVPKNLFVLFSDVDGLDIEQLSSRQWRISAEHGLLSEEDRLLRDWSLEPFYAGQHIFLAGAQLQLTKVNQLGNIVEVLLEFPVEQFQDFQLYQWSNNQLHLWREAE